MQLMPLLLVMVVMAVDNGLRPLGADWHWPHSWVWAIAWGPVLAVLLTAWIGESIVDRRLSKGRRHRPLAASEMILRFSRWALLANHVAAVLVFNWLGAIRAVPGDLILVDELLAILPPLVGLAGLFWIHYPIERRLRDSVLIRQLDEGRPVYPTLSRGQYVVLQVRLQLLLTMVPVLLIVGIFESLNHIPAIAQGQALSWIGQVAAFVGAVSIFMFAPLLARVLLDVQPLAPGPIRADLQAVCDRHRVRMRDLLIWNTNGSMINAAVMGLIGPLRYVMITDMLLETLRREQVQAVMAHEIGHVRRHHMPWMIVSLLAAMAVGWAFVVVPMSVFASVIAAVSLTAAEAVQGASLIGQLVVGLLIFGWVSRRFERQADTFAVQHLSGLGQEPAFSSDAEMEQVPLPAPVNPIDGTQVVRPESVLAMQGALQVIAVLNTVPPDRASWRHGSILWRQRYLASIVGKPIAALPIDRVVRRIKIAAAIIVILGLPLQIWGEFRNGQISEQQNRSLEISAERPRSIDSPSPQKRS